MNIGILGLCIVDAWKLHKTGKGFHAKLWQATFYEQLADALIKNSLGRIVVRSSPDSMSLKTESPSSGRLTQLTPVKRRRILKG